MIPSPPSPPIFWLFGPCIPGLDHRLQPKSAARGTLSGPKSILYDIYLIMQRLPGIRRTPSAAFYIIYRTMMLTSPTVSPSLHGTPKLSLKILLFFTPPQVPCTLPASLWCVISRAPFLSASSFCFCTRMFPSLRTAYCRPSEILLYGTGKLTAPGPRIRYGQEL
jgi:hypothetical protein